MPVSIRLWLIAALSIAAVTGYVLPSTLHASESEFHPEELRLLEAPDLAELETFANKLLQIGKGGALLAPFKAPPYTLLYREEKAGVALGYFSEFPVTDDQFQSAQNAWLLLERYLPLHLYQEPDLEKSEIDIFIVPDANQMYCNKYIQDAWKFDPHSCKKIRPNPEKKLSPAYANGTSSTTGRVEHVRIVAQSFRLSPVELEFVVVMGLYSRLTGFGISDAIYPSLSNAPWYERKGEALKFFMTYRRLPLIDYIMFQACWLVAQLPEGDRPETGAEFAKIMQTLLQMPNVRSLPADLYKNYPLPN